MQNINFFKCNTPPQDCVLYSIKHFTLFQAKNAYLHIFLRIFCYTLCLLSFQGTAKCQDGPPVPLVQRLDGWGYELDGGLWSPNVTAGSLYANCTFVPDTNQWQLLDRISKNNPFFELGAYYAFFAWEDLNLYQATFPWATFIPGPGMGPNTNGHWRVLGCGNNGGNNSPEIEVRGKGVVIADGDNSPSILDDTDFGSLSISGETATHTFTIHNTGLAPLQLTGTPPVAVNGVDASDFTVVTQPSATVAAGGSTTFTVRFDPSAAGTRSARLSIANNDSDENPYDFSIQGKGTSPPAAVPEIALRGNDVNIVDGDITPSVEDGTDFGSTAVNGGVVERTFTLRNEGSAPLNLTGNPRVAVNGLHELDFTVITQPASPVAAGCSTTFTVRFDPIADGTRSARLRIANNDSDENPFDFAIQGIGTTSPVGQPEITVMFEWQAGPGTVTGISLGSTQNLGSLNSGVTELTQTFIIRNEGTGPLNLTGNPRVAVSGTHAAEFTVLEQPAATVAKGGSTSFTVRFRPGSIGIHTAQLSIPNNDSDENPFIFTVEGSAAPFFASAITLPAANVTSNSALLRGKVSAGRGPSSSVLFFYRVKDTHAWIPCVPDQNNGSVSGSESKEVSFPLSGLSSSTTYEFFVQIENVDGRAEGEVLTFTTEGIIPPVTLPTATTTNASAITTTSVSTGGNVTDNGGATVTERGVVYATTQNPTTVSGTKVVSGSGMGSFTVNLTGLAANTTYYVRAYAINTAGLAYGPQVSFRTLALSPPVIMQQPLGKAIFAGESVTLSVMATGQGIVWQWYAGARGNTSTPVVGATGPLLTINPVSNVSYWVRITNEAGFTDSTAAAITVNTVPAGQTWTSVTSGVGMTLWGVEWLGNQFVVVGDNGVILTSPDGTTWTRRTSGTTQQLEGLAWSGKEYVAVGEGGVIVSSPDAVRWTQRSIGMAVELNNVAWDGGAFNAVGPGGSIMQSADGRSWQRVNSNILECYNIRFFNGTLVAGGPDGKLLTSINGTNWTLRLDTAGMFYDDMASNGVTWLATGSDGKVRLSANKGQTWDAGRVVASTWLRGAASDGVNFVVVGNDGVIYSSPQGTVWTRRTSNFTGALHAVAWNGRCYVAVGENGKILQSAGAWQGASAGSYEQWAASWGMSGGYAGPANDWDGDGVPNGLEYIGGTRPGDISDSWNPQPEIYHDGPTRKLRLAYSGNIKATSANFVVEMSSDLKAWSVISPGQPSGDGTGFTNRREWSAPLSSFPAQALFRFRYSLP